MSNRARRYILAGLASALGLGLSMLAVAGYKLTAQRHGRIQRFLGRRAVTRSGPGG